MPLVATPVETVAGLDVSNVAGPDRFGPVPPGGVLREDFMRPLGLAARALARKIRVPSTRITAILSGQRAVTARTAILPGERFGTSATFWLNLQMMRDLEEARLYRQHAA